MPTQVDRKEGIKFFCMFCCGLVSWVSWFRDEIWKGREQMEKRERRILVLVRGGGT